MKYFDKDFLDFFIELAANNHKEWFDENRKGYENSVKKPFENYIKDLIHSIRKHDPELNIEPKDAIFRINRDIRFSQDKMPYKLDRSANISPGGRKDHSTPGFYLSLGPDKVYFGGGAYFLSPTDLGKVRHYIKDNLKPFEKALSDKTFKATYSDIRGEENKRLPKEFMSSAEEQPLLFKKQFYYMAEAEPELILRDDLLDLSMEYYHASQPVTTFLRKALR